MPFFFMNISKQIKEVNNLLIFSMVLKELLQNTASVSMTYALQHRGQWKIRLKNIRVFLCSWLLVDYFKLYILKLLFCKSWILTNVNSASAMTRHRELQLYVQKGHFVFVNVMTRHGLIDWLFDKIQIHTWFLFIVHK